MTPPPENTVRLLLFDIDGTLLDTKGAGREAIRTAMEVVYRETGPIDSFDFHGKTDPGILRGLLRAAGWEDDAVDERMGDFWPLYLRELERALESRDGEVAPYPGVSDLMDELRRDPRFEVALVTGNVAGGAWRKLAAAGLEGHFQYGAFGSDSEYREDLPPLALRRARQHLGRPLEPDQAWVIGDTPEDIRCARIAGVRVMAVATGRHTSGQLRSHDPDRVMDTLSGTRDVLKALAQ